MHPVLVTIGSFSIETYYVIWGVAMCASLIWMRSRCEKYWGISYNDASEVMFYAIIGMSIGATLGGYADNWQRYADDPSRLLVFWESGMSSGPAFLGGGLAGLWKIHKIGASPDDFAEAASLPCSVLLAVGRWGCFFSGCCRGIPTESFLSVVFPDSAVSVYPSQLFESAACFAIALILWITERFYVLRCLSRRKSGAVLWPIFLILYGAYRSAFDFLRAGDRILGLRVGQYSGVIAVILGVWWLRRTFRARSASAHA